MHEDRGLVRFTFGRIMRKGMQAKIWDGTRMSVRKEVERTRAIDYPWIRRQ